MKAFFLYHPNSEGSRLIEEYAHDFEGRKNIKLELISLETREGSSTASLYDIVHYPALLVVDADGHLQKGWQGETLPLMDELAAYLVV